MKRLGLLLLMVLWLGGAAQAASRYELILLDSPDDYYGTGATAINNQSEIVGWCLNNEMKRVAIYWDPRNNYAPVIIGIPPGYERAEARGINDSGDVVGVAYANSLPTAVFIWNPKTQDMVQLHGLAGSARHEAFSIHNNGKAYGYSYFNGVGFRACIFELDKPAVNISGGYNNEAIGVDAVGVVAGNEQSSRTTNGAQAVKGYQNFEEIIHFLTPGNGLFHSATATNEYGHVAGRYEPAPGTRHAFLWNGTLQDLGTLGGYNSEALAINKHQQMVGWSNTTEGGTSGFLYRPGKGMSDLNLLDVIGKPPAWQWWFGQARGINDYGEIVGEAHTGGLGYLLRPQAIDIPALIMLLLFD